MHDEPEAVTLLEAMATTLTDQVVPASTGGAQHAARVVANLCRVIARDLGDDDPAATHDALQELLGSDRPFPELVAELDQQIARGDAPDGTLQLLLADAARRAEIAKPGYTDRGRA